MSYVVDRVDKRDYQELVELWEAAVRATHDFLKEEDIEFFRPLILDVYLDAVDLRCVRGDTGRIIGFLGVSEGNLEMLFIHPDFRGQQVGKTLLLYSINRLAVVKVDVNEQNQQAVGFYEKFGFVVKWRSELDGSGKPYPTLHMELVR